MSTQVLPLHVPAERQTLIPRIERNQRMVAFAQTAPGKLAILAGAAALFEVRGVLQPWIMIVLAAISFAPRYRWVLMAAGGVLWIPAAVEFPAAGKPALVTQAVCVASVVALAAVLFAVKAHWPKGVVARNPRLTWLAIFALAVVIAIRLPQGPARGAAWLAVVTLAACFWFLSYGFSEAPTERPGWRAASSLFSLWPVGFASSTPFFKRPSQMRRLEAKTAEEFALAQLKGIKLLGWSFLLSIAFALFDMAREKLGVPMPPDAIAASTAGHPFPWYLCWASLGAGFIDSVMRMAIWGNTVVAGCRLAGFKMLRNSWRPMESQTIVDFWNRYYYYFKELIADFFFFPVYMRCFKKHPRWRMFFATWVSVGVGVPLFHFIRDIHYVDELGLRQAVVGFHVYLCYATMLAIGIGISQMRKTSARGREAQPFRIRAIAGVVVFFCFLQVFDDPGRTVPLREHLLFLARLAGHMN